MSAMGKLPLRGMSATGGKWTQRLREVVLDEAQADCSKKQPHSDQNHDDERHSIRAILS